jgi:hypothetical protein
MRMSTEKGSARGFSAVLGGITVMGLKHPASRTARTPTAKRRGTKFPEKKFKGTEFLSFAIFIHNSLIEYKKPRF